MIALLIILILIAHFIGGAINNQTPEGGINESMYVEINGTKQWRDDNLGEKGNIRDYATIY